MYMFKLGSYGLGLILKTLETLFENSSLLAVYSSNACGFDSHLLD